MPTGPTKKPQTQATTLQQITPPIEGGPTQISSPFGERNHGSPPHTHMGMDVPVPTGTGCFAPVDGRISLATGSWDNGGMVHFQFTQDLGAIKKGDVIGWGHVQPGSIQVKSGQSVQGGQLLAKSNHPAPHVHFIYQSPGASPGTQDGTDDPHAIYLMLAKGKAPTTGGGGGGTGNAADGSLVDVEAIAKAASLSAFLELPGVLDQQESLALQGERSLMNDQPLMPFIEQLCQSSLRHFQSMPSGNFFAFFPDYFGGLSHRTPYWRIEDIEIIDGTIDLSDDELATHVYVVGDIANFDGVNLVDRMQTAGVATVMNAFMADFINGIESPDIQNSKTSADGKKLANDDFQKQIKNLPTLADKDRAISFLKKYGARPYYEEAPMVRSPYFEMFLAYQKFCLLWSRQFLTTFTFTFMPELFPGGIVAFPDHGIQCYIDEVSHEGSYTDGFVTRANLSAPTTLKGTSGNPNANEGMIRAFIFADKEGGK